MVVVFLKKVKRIIGREAEKRDRAVNGECKMMFCKLSFKSERF